MNHLLIYPVNLLCSYVLQSYCPPIMLNSSSGLLHLSYDFTKDLLHSGCVPTSSTHTRPHPNSGMFIDFGTTPTTSRTKEQVTNRRFPHSPWCTSRPERLGSLLVCLSGSPLRPTVLTHQWILTQDLGRGREVPTHTQECNVDRVGTRSQKSKDFTFISIEGTSRVRI